MPTFTWNETYSVGIETFDEHHKKLIEIINQLYDAMRLGKGNQELQSILTTLIDYTNFHFTSEEKILAEYNYPDFTKHRAEHKALKQKVVDFQQKMQKEEIGMSVQVANFLKDWLTNHINVEDKKYRSFLQAKGVK